MITMRAIVSGRVQGVGFRYFVNRQAEALELRGWVRNCSDGTVETLLQGAEEAVKEMLAVLEQGPPASRVDQVQSSDATADEAQGHSNRFEIRY